MKGIILLVCIVCLAACDRKPFVEHKVKFEKVSDGCAGALESFRLNSNFGGERYEFQKCLAADFSKEQVMASRSGDTVTVLFKKPEEGKAKATFTITLDIDSYPKYHYITIDGETYAIVSSN